MASPSITLSNVDVNEFFSVSRRRVKIGPWGATRACSFDNIGGSVSRITRVGLHTGIIVDSLELSYVVDRNNFELLPGEYINSMVGSFKTFCGETCIAKLGFTTNLGKKHGPFGQGGGVEFSVPVVDGRIVGFFGQFGRYLNGIGVYLAPN
ncbi:hypothetical protein ZIOFF_036904 [Zingiber officinale]|uniref:Jacalin-type lectin domain-containing protein n=1 Tax=Zingiber officinale TaxID=94328 RepID=A0A8J5GAQ3_ZINOF|nr:hypothetical protein ZIOFF_036904 [Zingiber officinale]